MKEGPRTDPLAAALRVKDFARDLAKDVATDLADGYRKSTRFVRMRAAVVGAWALLAVGSIWAACPGSGHANALGAEVQITTQGLMGTQVSVVNASDSVWTDVTLTLDDTWRFTTPTVRAKDSLVVGVDRFTQENGASARRDLVPHLLTIRCAEGKVTAPLTGAKAP
jgi:hypothetical protein